MTQAALFDDLPAEPQAAPRKIADMHARYGTTPGATCKTCAHLCVKRMGGTYYKCDLTRITAGPGSDWRTGYAACGKWEADEH